MVPLMQEWAEYIPDLEILATSQTAQFDPEGLNRRMAAALNSLRQQEILRHRYDYTWIMTAIGDGALAGMSRFKSPQSFIDYLADLGIEQLPSRTTLSTWFGRVLGKFPHWEFTDTTDVREIQRRIGVVKHLLSELAKENSAP